MTQPETPPLRIGDSVILNCATDPNKNIAAIHGMRGTVKGTRGIGRYPIIVYIPHRDTYGMLPEQCQRVGSEPPHPPEASHHVPEK